MTKILVINCGSSTIKYQLINMDSTEVLCSGLVEKIGESISRITHKKFPDTDQAYLGIDSMILLDRVRVAVSEKGYRVGNVDCTILAQKPKLAPYIPKMKIRIAEVLHVDPDQVNVKATTEERLGFTGREEGIAAHAVCILE